MLDHYGEEKVITLSKGSYTATLKTALVNQFIDFSTGGIKNCSEYSERMLCELGSSVSAYRLLNYSGIRPYGSQDSDGSYYFTASPLYNQIDRLYSVLRVRLYVKYTGLLSKVKKDLNTFKLYFNNRSSGSLIKRIYSRDYSLTKNENTLICEYYFVVHNKSLSENYINFYYDLDIGDIDSSGEYSFDSDLLHGYLLWDMYRKSSVKAYKDPDGTAGYDIEPGKDSLYIEVPEFEYALWSQYYDYVFFFSKVMLFGEEDGHVGEVAYYNTPLVFKNLQYETIEKDGIEYRKYKVLIPSDLIGLNYSNPLINNKGERYSFQMSWAIYSKIQQESQDRILYVSEYADAFEPGYALLSGTNFVNTYFWGRQFFYKEGNVQDDTGFYIKIPESMAPVLNEFGILPYNDSDFYTNYVSGYTRVRFVMSSEIPLDNTLHPEMWVKVTSPDNKETLYEIDNNGMPYSFPNGILLESSGDYTFTPILKLYTLFYEECLDEKEIRYAWPYGPPQLRGFDCRRCDLDPQSGEYVLSDDGFNLMVNYSTEVSEIGDPNINGSEVTLKYKRCIDSSWSDEIKIPLDSSGRCIVPIASGSSVPAQFDKDSAFDISLKITDDFGTFTRYRDILSTTFDLINFGYGGKSFAFGKASDPKYNGQTEDPDDNPTLENAMNNVFYKDISMAYSRDAKKVGILGSIVSLLQFLKNILSTDYDCFRYLSNAESADAYDSNDKVGSYIVYKDPNSEDFTVSNLPSNSGPGVLLVMSPFYKTENPEYDDSHNPEHDSVIQVYINEVVTNGISLRSHNYIQEEDPDHPGQYIFRGRWTDWVSLF